MPRTAPPSAPVAYWRACAAESRAAAADEPLTTTTSARRVLAWMDASERRSAATRATLDHRRYCAARRALALVSAQRDERQPSALALAGLNAAQRASARERQSIAQRDALERARQYPLTEDELLARVSELVAALHWLTEDERGEALAVILLRLIQRHGCKSIPAAQVTREYVQSSATHHAQRQRERAARHSLYIETEDDDEPSEDLAALRQRVAQNIDALVYGPVASADELAADELAQRMGLDDYGAAALVYALGGYSTAKQYAAAAGIEHENAAKRIQRGRNHIRRRYPDADALAAAVHNAQAQHPLEARATAAQRKRAREAAAALAAARWLVEAARLRMYAHPGSGAVRGHVTSASAEPLSRMASTGPRVTAQRDALTLQWRSREAQPARPVGWPAVKRARRSERTARAQRRARAAQRARADG